MKMLGIDSDLDRLYEVLAKELEILSSVRTSRGRSRRSRRDESESYQVTLEEF